MRESRSVCIALAPTARDPVAVLVVDLANHRPQLSHVIGFKVHALRLRSAFAMRQPGTRLQEKDSFQIWSWPHYHPINQATWSERRKRWVE